MSYPITERLQDIAEVDRGQIDRILKSGKAVTIQFSKPGYSESLLRNVDDLCRELGSLIEVRFYGVGFDASCLALIPHVEWLSIDCLSWVSSIETLFTLGRLRVLSLGVFDLDRPDILAEIQSVQLRALRLCETRKTEINLAPLKRYAALECLHVAGHTRGFDALAHLKKLKELTLRSLPKKQRLEAVNELPKLGKLTLILGGREDIEELEHPVLNELEIIRVLGLRSIGDLGRFPSLQKLRIDDQIRLEAIDVSVCEKLRELLVVNCKTLRAIGRMAELEHLHHLRLSQTAVDLDSLVAGGLPSSVKIVGLYTGKKSMDEPMKARLSALGYREF